MKKKTPMELLREEKEALEIRSEILIHSLGDTLNYSQENIGSILRQSATEAILPMLPPFVRRIIDGKSHCPEENQLSASPINSLADTVLNVLPFFFKGKKGVVVAFILKKLKNMLWR